jgi:hypothetical protein
LGYWLWAAPVTPEVLKGRPEGAAEGVLPIANSE